MREEIWRGRMEVLPRADPAESAGGLVVVTILSVIGWVVIFFFFRGMMKKERWPRCVEVVEVEGEGVVELDKRVFLNSQNGFSLEEGFVGQEKNLALNERLKEKGGCGRGAGFA